MVNHYVIVYSEMFPIATSSACSISNEPFGSSSRKIASMVQMVAVLPMNMKN